MSISPFMTPSQSRHRRDLAARRRRRRAIIAGVVGLVLATLLVHIAHESFTSPRLVQLQAALSSEGVIASRAIARLGKRLNWLESSHNLLVRPLDLFLFWTPFCVAAIEAWRERHGAAIRNWLSTAGEVEALHAQLQLPALLDR